MPGKIIARIRNRERVNEWRIKLAPEMNIEQLEKERFNKALLSAIYAKPVISKPSMTPADRLELEMWRAAADAKAALPTTPWARFKTAAKEFFQWA